MNMYVFILILIITPPLSTSVLDCLHYLAKDVTDHTTHTPGTGCQGHDTPPSTAEV